MEKKILEELKKIKYGWLDKNNHIHIKDYDDFNNEYILESPDEVEQNKIGVCWDQVEYERYLFEKNNIRVKTYFIVHDDENICPTHTFLTFQKDKKYYWFEHAWELFEGVHEYNSENELLHDVRDKFIEFELKNDYKLEEVKLFEYFPPKYHISVQEFFKHCFLGKKIIIK